MTFPLPRQSWDSYEALLRLIGERRSGTADEADFLVALGLVEWPPPRRTGWVSADDTDPD